MLKVGHELTDAEITARYQKLGGSFETRRYFYPACAEFVGQVGSKTVLDAGCGNGALLSEIASRNPQAKLMGIELAQSRVDEARRKLGPHADVRCGSLTATLPFAPACTDIVLVTEVLEHLRDPVACLLNLKPLLKPGGHMIVTFPNATAWLPFSPIAALIAPHIKPIRGFLPHEHPLRTEQPIDTVFGKDEVYAMLRQANLRVVDAACYEVFPYIAEFAYKFARSWDIAPLRRPLDKLISKLGWVSLGYRVFTRCEVVT
jgi:2-polyprenyl-3-methyl-5-hydroxy-6-metoxy-1,4-benzoquinol methylase